MKSHPLIHASKLKSLSVLPLKVKMKMQNNEVTLKAPRSFIVFFVQYMSTVPFCTAFGFILLPFSSMFSINSHDIVILILLVLFFLVVGFAMLFFPQKQRTICVYDKNNNVLKKQYKNKSILTCDLTGIKIIILKIIKKDIGVNIKVLLEKTNGNIELYCEQNYLSYKQWIEFSDKLAMITSLPLVTVNE